MKTLEQMEAAIIEQMDEWSCAELFDYNIEHDILDEDEDFEDHINDRGGLLDEAKYHRENEILPKLSLEEITERYQRTV
jgi:hypothetical protein